MVFRKRGGLLPCERWNYNGQIIEAVNDFNYLGVLFNDTDNLNLNQEYLVGTSLKTLNVLLNTCKCKDFDLKPKVFCQLFDAFVGSVISYGAEVWVQSLKR